MKDKPEPRSITVVIVPKAYPGMDKFTAIRTQLRLLGVPPHQVPVSYTELLQMMENARNYTSSPRSIMNNIECYVVDDVFSRSYLIRKMR
jgi:hypothetical protein